MYEISDLHPSSDDHIDLNIQVSSVSKIACVLNSTALSPSQIKYIEGKETRFYIRTQTRTHVSFRVTFTPGIEQRLYCKLSGLLYDPYHVEYYQSEPFNTTCISFPFTSFTDNQIQMDSFHQALDIFYFTYTPKQIEWLSSSQPLKQQAIMCQWPAFKLNDVVPFLNEEQAVFISKDGLPVSVYGSVKNKIGEILHCGNFVKEDAGWRVSHVDSVKIQ